MATQNNIAILILAAGESSRMGQPKQLLPVNNDTLLQHAATTALNITPNVTVVLGANNTTIQHTLQHLPIQHIVNPDWPRGMGTSIKAGVAQCIASTPQLDAILLMTCDQPLITSQHLQNIITQYQTTNKHIVATTYNNTHGVPALFASPVFHKLLALDDTNGAKPIITQNPHLLTTVSFPPASLDLDTPHDYQSFLSSRHHPPSSPSPSH